MKKLLQMKFMLLLCALIVGSGTMWADTETITAKQFGFTANTNLSGDNATLTATNFTLTFAQNESTNVPVYNSKDEEFRLYKISSGKTNGATITIAAISENVTFNKVVFDFSNLPTNYSFSSGSYEASTKTWSGDATSSLTLTNTDFSGQLKIKSMTITYEEQSTPTGPLISANDATVSWDAEGGNIEYTISNPLNPEWEQVMMTTDTGDNWLQSGDYGSNGKIPFTVDTNYGDERSATVTLTYSYKLDSDNTVYQVNTTATVTQTAKPAPVIIVGQDSYTIGKDQTSIEIPYTIQYPNPNTNPELAFEGNTEWTTLGRVFDYDNNKVTITTDANNTPERTVNVVFKYDGAADKTVTLTQEGVIWPTVSFRANPAEGASVLNCTSNSNQLTSGSMVEPGSWVTLYVGLADNYEFDSWTDANDKLDFSNTTTTPGTDPKSVTLVFQMPEEDIDIVANLKSNCVNMTIDFESAATAYTDWTFTNIVSNYSTTGVTAHGGSKYGSTDGKASGSIQTKERVNPASLTCYVSKESTNTTASSWYIQVSSDGTTWENVTSRSASNMSKGEWKEFTANLSDYSDVYVRVYYGNNTARRCIDDLTLVVKKDTRAEAGLAFEQSEYSVELVNAASFTSPVLSNPNELSPITWTSSNETVATVNEGTVTILSEGETTIKAKFEGNDDYKPGEASYTLTVVDNRQTATVTWKDADGNNITELNVEKGDFIQGITLSCNVEGFTFTEEHLQHLWGTNETHDNYDGLQPAGYIFTPNAVWTAALGITTITATFPGNETHKPASATLTVNVTGGTVTYTLAHSITPGKHYIIVGKTGNDDFYAMGTQNTNNRAAVEVTDNDGTISVAKDGSISEFIIDIAGVYYSIYDEAYNENAGGYLYAAGSSNNYLKTQAINDANGRWEITIDSDTGVATVKAKESNNRNVMRFNSTSTLFSCYSSGQEDIYLYENDNELVIPIAAACTDGTKCYSTFSSSKPFVVPEGLTVSEIKILSDGTMKVESYDTDDVVPADRGVMVSAAKGGNYVVNISKEAGTSKLGTNNALRPTGDDGISIADMEGKDSNCKFYRLTMHKGKTLGFWYGAENGDGFDIAANKAYLAVPKELAAAREGFAFDDDSTTGISNVNVNENVNGSVFDLQGRKVSKPGKGLYIVNGKKVVIK